jgi:hypothetical protein
MSLPSLTSVRVPRDRPDEQIGKPRPERRNDLKTVDEAINQEPRVLTLNSGSPNTLAVAIKSSRQVPVGALTERAEHSSDEDTTGLCKLMRASHLSELQSGLCAVHGGGNFLSLEVLGRTTLNLSCDSPAPWHPEGGLPRDPCSG